MFFLENFICEYKIYIINCTEDTRIFKYKIPFKVETLNNITLTTIEITLNDI